MVFPQFRKYKNGLSYFEILGKSEFIEYKLEFNKIEKHLFTAKILPDRNFIHDLLYNYEEHCEKIEKEDLEDFLLKNQHKSD